MFFSNICILLLHVFAIGALTLFFLRRGKEALIAWSSFLCVIANLFVNKQVTLFGLDVTCSDGFIVGYLLSTNCLQEFFGKKTAQLSISLALFISIAFMLFSFIHLLYIPSAFDLTHDHFDAILSPMARITVASLLSFFAVQLLDLKFFHYLREKTQGRHLGQRLFISSLLSHTLDTVLFSFLGLYGTVASISSVILFSLCLKMVVVLVLSPFMALSRRVVRATV